VPDKPKTPQRVIRLDDQLWHDLGQHAAELGTDRSAIIRELTSWWLRRPGAKMPPRPRAALRG
jgi:hypothetical protein